MKKDRAVRPKSPAAADHPFGESERYFRQMIDALPAAIYTTDANGHLTHFNPAAVKLSGRTPQIGTDEWCVSWKLYRPDGTPLPHDECPMAIALKQGRVIHGEEILVERPDGTRLWCTPYPTPLRDASGKVIGGINMLLDITERKHAEQRLHDSEQRFTQFMEHLPGLAWIKDSNGRYVYANDAAQRAFQTQGADLYGKSDGDVFARETATQFSAHDAQVMDGESSIQTVEELTHSDGIVHHSVVNKFAIPGLDGKGPMVGGIAIDITDIKKAEEALRESEATFRTLAETHSRLAALVESSDDAIVSKDLNGVIMSWNAGAQRLFGYTAEEAVGQSVTLLIPPERYDEEPGVLARIRRGEKVDHYETVRRHKDGTLFDVSLTVSPIRNYKGEVVGASKIARDITESKRSAEMLRHANRRKDEFLAMLAHELRNPLAPILVSLEILRRARSAAGIDDPDVTTRDLNQRAGSAVDVLDRQVGQMVRLVDDLLDASRISRGKIELRRQRVDLSTVIHGAVEVISSLAERKGQELTVTLPAVPVVVDADPTRLAQIVGNLLISSSLAGGWFTVARPSAHSPTQPAVSTLTAGPISGGDSRGNVCSFARSTFTSPSWETVSPAKSARMMSTHSRRRALRVALSGHGSPVMCSFDASPVPSATHSRPGNISPRVAAAWATIAGW